MLATPMIDPVRRRLEEAVLRSDFQAFFARSFRSLKPRVEFEDRWYHEHICWGLNAAWQGEERRLIVNVPPRSGKSLMISVAFPMFLLGHDPSLEIMAISHTESLARDFSLQRRAISEQTWFRRTFPELEFKRVRNMDLETTQGGRIFASGVGGAVLGKGADVLIIDDPEHGNAAYSEAERRRFNEFYDNTLIGRLNNKSEGVVILVMQRLHQDDATGHLMQSDEFRHISLPAFASEDIQYPLSDVPGDVYRRQTGEVLNPDREPMEVLERVRRAQGATYFQAQYQQDPAPASGNVVKRNWLKYYDERPETFDRTVVSWDTASTVRETSDWSVGTIWGAKGFDYYLLDLVRGRFEPVDLRRQIIAFEKKWNPDITVIEDTELGRSLASELRASRELALHLQGSFEAKETRFLAQAARFETGQVHLPRTAPYIAEYVNEILAFPASRHDDQVDCTSQALAYLTRFSNWVAPRERPSGKRRSDRPRPAGAPRNKR
ncbi:MAG: phage terminase large subunit [Caulobacteraceae bacterium]